MLRPRLTEAEKQQVEDMAAEGLTTNRIALELDRSFHTIQKHIDSPDIRQRIAAKLKGSVERVIDSISDNDITKASLAQKGVFIGIGIEKMNLLEGLATGLDVHVLVDAVEALRQARQTKISPTIELQP